MKKLLGAAKVAVAMHGSQPNKERSVGLLLDPDEVPGGEWYTDLQQDMVAHAFNKGDPEILRAKSIQSTASRRLLKTNANRRSIFIEVGPFANSDDAMAWAASADDRTRRSMSGLMNLQEFALINDIELKEPGIARIFQYSSPYPEGLRISIAVSASVATVFLKVTCTDFGQPWPLEDVLEIVRAQMEKIRARENSFG